MTNKKKVIFLYLFFDIVAALLTWCIFFVFRKYIVDETVLDNFQVAILNDYKFYIGLVCWSLYWVFLHAFSGCYNKIFRKSRLRELGNTLTVTFIGVLVFFFAFILDDIVNDYNDYLLYFLVLFGLQFLTTYIPRVCITTSTINRMRNGKIIFNTLIVGSDHVALQVYKAVSTHDPSANNNIIGYIMIDENDDDDLSAELPCLGKLDDLLSVVKKQNIKVLIIAIQNGNANILRVSSPPLWIWTSI